jgi:hypothetical protein
VRSDEEDGEWSGNGKVVSFRQLNDFRFQVGYNQRVNHCASELEKRTALKIDRLSKNSSSNCQANKSMYS